MRERIRQLSYFDHLTNLPNRASLQYYFDEVAGLRLPSAAFVWIDLDQFKNVNDSLGHSFGDILLQVMAKRFCQVLDPQAMVTRISGDDFVAFLPRVSVREALEYADRILHVTAEPVQLNGHALIVTASIGISMYPGDAREFDELLMHAEAAMYRAKAEGRNRYRFYEAHMQAQMRRALAVSSALRQAQENNEFTLVYQPQFSVDGARIVGVEALLRWHSSELGQVGPEEFIPLAEESDLILGIGAWVLESVVKQIKQWLDAGVHEPVVSINLSAAQFSLPDLPEQIATVLRRYDVPAGNLMIEITEASAMHAPLAAARRILELRKLGVLTAIDDFGTGYSSLAYLQRFKVHQIKIDQSFVCDIDHSAQARAIARAVIELARALEMDTLAEGVETRTQLEFLQANGCTSVQGYYFSQPLDADDLLEFARNFQGPPL